VLKLTERIRKLIPNVGSCVSKITVRDFKKTAEEVCDLEMATTDEDRVLGSD